MDALKALYALYSDSTSADRAYRSLCGATSEWGIPASAVAVLSSVPQEHSESARAEAKTKMPWLAALGGVLGGLSGYALTSYTQRAFPIPTGGMSIVPLWTDGIIIYELTMLGAILATLFTLLVTARIPSWKRRLYDPQISDGKILVGVLDLPEQRRAAIEKALREAGAESVKTVSL